MSNTNFPTRDAPYMTPATLTAALSPTHLDNLRERLRGPWLPESVDRDRKQAADAIDALLKEASSWKAVAHDHSERLKALAPPTPLDAEFRRAFERAGVREPIEVYTSNSYRRVGLKSEYNVVLSAFRHNDGQTDISNATLLEALVAAFNAMLARQQSPDPERAGDGR